MTDLPPTSRSRAIEAGADALRELARDSVYRGFRGSVEAALDTMAPILLEAERERHAELEAVAKLLGLIVAESFPHAPPTSRAGEALGRLADLVGDAVEPVRALKEEKG